MLDPVADPAPGRCKVFRSRASRTAGGPEQDTRQGARCQVCRSCIGQGYEDCGTSTGENGARVFMLLRFGLGKGPWSSSEGARVAPNGAGDIGEGDTIGC